MVDLLPAAAPAAAPAPAPAAGDQAVAYHESGAVRETVQLQGRVPHGEVVGYAESGRVVLRATMRDGVLDGAMTLFGPDGLPEQTCRYAGGRLHGDTVAYRGGEVWRVTPFVHGRRHGEALGYHPGGVLESRMPYVDGVLEGTAEFRDPAGRLIRSAPYAAGVQEGETVDYYPSGAVRERSRFAAGQMEGEAVAFYESGALQRRVVYAGGRPAGPAQVYDEGGKQLGGERPPLWRRAAAVLGGRE